MSDHLGMEQAIGGLQNFCTADGRICPQPVLWHCFWLLLKDSAHQRRTPAYHIAQGVDDDGVNFRLRIEPPLPNILSSWWASPDSKKTETLREQLLWAAERKVLDVAEKFLRVLPVDGWHRRVDPTAKSLSHGLSEPEPEEIMRKPSPQDGENSYGR